MTSAMAINTSNLYEVLPPWEVVADWITRGSLGCLLVGIPCQGELRGLIVISPVYIIWMYVVCSLRLSKPTT